MKIAIDVMGGDNFPEANIDGVISKPYDSSKIINFVYLGGISEIRGINNILQFAYEINNKLNFKIHLIGPFRNVSLKNKVKNNINVLKLENRFEFHGIINNNNALDMLQNYDFGSRIMIFQIEDHQIAQNFEANPMEIAPHVRYTLKLRTRGL